MISNLCSLESSYMVVAPELGDTGADIQLASLVFMVKNHLLSMQSSGGNP